MTRSPARLLASATLAAGLVLSAGTAAHADSAVIKDKASDVIEFTLDFNSDSFDSRGTQLDYRPSLDSGIDLRSMRVSHGRRTLAVTMRFAELRRGARVVVAFRTDGKGVPEQTFTTTNSRTGKVTDEDNTRTCTVPVRTKTGRGGQITAVIDRSCLGSPRRIKVASASISVKETSKTSYRLRQDVVSPTRFRGPTWSPWLTSS